MRAEQVFESASYGRVRAVKIGGELWLSGRDVAQVFGYREGRGLIHAVANHVKPEDKRYAKIDTGKGKQNMAVINKSGFLSLAYGSSLRDKKRIGVYKWLMSEAYKEAV